MNAVPLAGRSPRVKIISRANSACLLECGHLTDVSDKRRRYTYCFDCFKGRGPHLAKFGFSFQEYAGYCKAVGVEPRNIEGYTR